MFRAFLFVLIPVVLVSVGTMVITRQLGLSSLYPDLFIGVLLLCGAILWFRSRAKPGSKTGSQ
jgi:hypothetical protein